MMSPDDRLVHMANQIALNLAAQGPDVAATMVAGHIGAFWDPRMRAKLLAMLGEDLSPIAAAAVALLRRGERPSAGMAMPSPAGGDGSDAG